MTAAESGEDVSGPNYNNRRNYRTKNIEKLKNPLYIWNIHIILNGIKAKTKGRSAAGEPLVKLWF
ncbi:MAG: hypothetical protein Q4F76_08610 [Lachnospiraceae bacterium]|nr:hypothetical protein [Lachnospiraceae bacterium]